MEKGCLAIAGLLLVASVLGCVNSRPASLLNTDPAPVQQRRAERYDPYPDPYAGPALEGTRPREYQQPYAPPLRDYMDDTQPGWWARGGRNPGQ